jgi:hypothetical protein
MSLSYVEELCPCVRLISGEDPAAEEYPDLHANRKRYFVNHTTKNTR